ncbi:MAG: class I tRNA ligase family protein, partial [Pseudomonadota bacterium]
MSGSDYRDTVFLPKTHFPMRAGLPKREPLMLDRWAAQGIEARRTQTAAGRPRFVLHDGPPYANGHLHMGHVLNKVLKDVVNRARWAQGYDARYRPGWDCHGLPIEWKIEERFRAEGRDKDEVPILDFRRECREFAAHWIGVQSAEFQRLGLVGDWNGRYATMDFAAEAAIVRELHKFALNGALYRGLRPVLWSTAEKTALADAEVEYHDHTSDTIHVRFPIARPSEPALADTDAVIWTTTPWTMPANRAIAFGPEVAYAVARAADGAKLLIAEALLDAAAAAADTTLTIESRLPGAALAGTVARHPLADGGYGFDVPLLPGDFVTTEQGTGLVHIAPSHGMDDFELGRAHGIEPAFTVGEDGRFLEHVPLFAGRTIYDRDGKKGDANAAVIDAMAGAGKLFARSKLHHSYPHSWRSKAPLIFRATAQWFVSMEANGLRDKALRSIAETDFRPESGRRRLQAMVETRPDWCVSRQRAWGVPIAVFARESDGAVLQDAAVYERVAQAFEDEGGDAWWTEDPARFLGPDHDPAEWLPVRDILD